MTPKLCIYKCGTLLEGWDDEARKYKEAGTGGLHTKERCQEAKAKLEAKNDHGNETVFSGTTATTEGKVVVGFVDHTQGPKLKLKILTDPTPEGMELKYNNFGDSHNIRFSQSHMPGSLYVTWIWYEEIPLKQ